MSSSKTKNNHNGSGRPKEIWIDLENSPHVPFFKPIIEELERRGYSVLITARDCFQVCDLADLLHVPCKRIGRHYGKHMVAKAVGLGVRTLQLISAFIWERPDLAVSHGSRSTLVVSSLLRIPSFAIFDYEHTKGVGFFHPSWVMVPDILHAALPIANRADRVLHYPGIKEDVYAPSFRPDPSIRERLHLRSDDIVVTVRPPASDAHYHNPESEILLDSVFDLIGNHPNAKAVVLPRTPRQEHELRKKWATLFSTGKIMVPEHVVDGMDLIWFSDLVISGGGTMNREAAALGVPVYSIFRGTLGAVDKSLAESGRLTLLTTREDVRTRIALVHRNFDLQPKPVDRPALHVIVESIVSLVESGGKRGLPSAARLSTLNERRSC
jgi:predicted glycosyltransferase